MPRPSPSRRVPPVTQTSTGINTDTGQRLQKFLASAGVDSRRNCESYIREGRVTVNDIVIRNPGASVQPEVDDVRLDGERLKLPKLKYYLLNKPKGVLCTNSDPSGRPKAIDFVPGRGDRLFTVGRLDENTQGLLLLTNDGDLAERLAHPRYEVVRRYKAQVAGVPKPETLAELRKGMHFSDGFFRFRKIRFLKRRGQSAFVEIELREGKNREIRRMLARAGHKVIHLERVAFGPLTVGQLPVGRCRALQPREISELRAFVLNGPTQSTKRQRPRRHSSDSTGRNRRPRSGASGKSAAGQHTPRSHRRRGSK